MYGTLSQSVAGLIDGLCETYGLSKLNETKLRNVITGRGGMENDQLAFIIVRTVRDNIQTSDKNFQDIWAKVATEAIRLSRLNQAVFDFLIMVPLEVANTETNFQQIMEEFLASEHTDKECKTAAEKINAYLHFIRKELQEDYDKLRRLSSLVNRVREDYRTHSVDECIFKNWLDAKADEPVKFSLFAADVLKILKNADTPKMVSFEEQVAKGQSPEFEAPGRRVSATAEVDLEQVNPFDGMTHGDDIELALEDLMESRLKPFTDTQYKSVKSLIMTCANTDHSIPLTIVRIHCLQPLQNRIIQAHRLKKSAQEIDDIINTTALDGYETAQDMLSLIKSKLKSIALSHRYHRFLSGSDDEIAKMEDAEEVQCKEAYNSLKKRLNSKLANEDIGFTLSSVIENTSTVYSFIMKVERVLSLLPQEGLEKQFVQDRLKFVEKCTREA